MSNPVQETAVQPFFEAPQAKQPVSRKRRFIAAAVSIVAVAAGGITAAGLTQASPSYSAAEPHVIGTLNWRGASHFRRNPHPGERSYRVRMPYMIAEINRSRASIVGFQEFEGPQRDLFMKRTKHAWGLVLGRNARGKADPRDAIAYRRALWRVVETRFVTITYSPGDRIKIPLAKFRSTRSKQTVWVLNTHNPAGAVGAGQRIRDRDVRIEATVLRRVVAANPGVPVLFTGDMNDRREFKSLFLRVAGKGWKPANRTDRQIDWIMGGPGVRFPKVTVNRRTNDRAHRYTDHPYVYATWR